MRQRCVPREGSAEERSFRFIPKDPVWAPAESLDRARKALKAFDPHLNLWWSPVRRSNTPLVGRWRVVTWIESTGTWDTLFYWEGPNGEYRPPLPVDPIISRAASMDLAARGIDMKKLSKEIDEHNAKLDAKRKFEREQAAWDTSHEAGMFAAKLRRSYKAAKVDA